MQFVYAMAVRGMYFYPRDVGMGDILLIYYDSASKDAKDFVLQGVKKTATDLVTDEIWPKIQEKKTVIVKPSELEVLSLKPRLFEPEVTEHEVEPYSSSFDDKMEGLQRALLPIDSVFAVIIDGLAAEEGYLPKTQDWIDFMVQVYGDLSEVALFLTFDVDQGRKLGYTNEAEIITAMNSTMTSDFEQRLHILSVTM